MGKELTNLHKPKINGLVLYLILMIIFAVLYVKLKCADVMCFMYNMGENLDGMSRFVTRF